MTEHEELAALIDQIALAWEPNVCLLGNMTASQLARAAALLREPAPAPVPVPEDDRPQERQSWCDMQGRCWLAGLPHWAIPQPPHAITTYPTPQIPPQDLTSEQLMEVMPQRFRDDLAAASELFARNAKEDIGAFRCRVLLNTAAVAYARAAIAADRAANTPSPSSNETQ